MHLVIPGGNGFIGSHLVARAVDAGHRVTVVGNSPQPRWAHGRAFHFVSGGLAALASQPGLIEAADAVCHFATATIPASSNADPVWDIEGNLIATVRLLEAMRNHGNKRIIYLSSGGAIYGNPEHLPMGEGHPLRPISSYGVIKAAIESYLGLYADLYKFRPTIIRPANPYGPGQHTTGALGAVTTFIRLALTGGTATVFGDGSTVRDFVFISDICDLILAAVESDATGTFNCGAGEGTSLAELLALVEAATGTTIPRDYKPPRGFDPPAVVLDIASATRTFSWTPKVRLQDGIRLTLDAMR